MRNLNSKRESLLSFTHTLEKQADGSCSFLDTDKLCKLHKEHGIEAKPSMCRLFPYSFTVTPDAVLASLSFASTAVLSNSGKLLSEQPETMAEQFKLFKQLFNPRPDIWQKLQLIDGVQLNWAEFSKLDGSIGEITRGAAPSPSEAPIQMGKLLRKISTRISKELSSESQCEREPKLESRPKIVDQILLKHLERLYFPEDLFVSNTYDLKVEEILKEIVSAPQQVSFGQGEFAKGFSELISFKLGKLDAEVENLIDRFFYVRLFSKLFFGPGFHHLSLLAGIHHLKMLHVLLRLKIKQTLLIGKSEKPDFLTCSELIRCMERRLTQLDLSPQTHSVMEVFLSSVQRQERIEFLSA